MPVKKIMVVDDSPTERFFLQDLLTKKGFTVISAETGEEGVAKAAKELQKKTLGRRVIDHHDFFDWHN